MRRLLILVNNLRRRLQVFLEAVELSNIKNMVLTQKANPRSVGCGDFSKNPGDDLLSQGLSLTTIGAATFHFRVRDGIGWFHSAIFTRETVGASPAFRLVLGE